MSYAADMTSEGAVVCQRCHYSFAFRTQLHYMVSKDGIRPGCNLCQGCYNYYLNKPTTVWCPAGKSIFALGSILFILKLITGMFLKPAGSEHQDDSLESLIWSKVVVTKENRSEVWKQIAEAQRGGESLKSNFFIRLRTHWPNFSESEGSHRVVSVGPMVTNHEVLHTVPAPATAATIGAHSDVLGLAWKP